MNTPYFHPAVSGWFHSTFDAPTPAQAQAWPAIQSGSNVLIAAPTGSGKTLAAFLAAIDELVREGEQWGLPNETRIVYVSPLKALSNDISRNLEAPLAGIRERLRDHTIRDVDIRTWVRTGDTPQSERSQMRRKPPHIVVTTPESLYILLGSQSGRDMLATTRSIIVDEIHALAGTKRGLHLALSMERLEALTGRRLTRIGLSATQHPIETVAHLLVGRRGERNDGSLDCRIIDAGHVRERQLVIEVPPAPLEAVMSNDVWDSVYERLTALIHQHRTTLIFVNTRRQAERVCRQLSQRLDGEIPKGASASVTAHHGSLAKELRLDAEQRLKNGQLKALVATASLELGIDIGDVDLVCQLASPRSINAFLQRVGRSGHAVGATPRGHLFPLSRDDLAECTALLDSVRRGELDQLKVPQLCIDVLAQQIVAEAAARDCSEQELFHLFRNAYPYRDLTRESFDEILRMLAEGFTTRHGRRGALIYHDAVNHTVRGRKGARLTAITSGGAIPDTADYSVMLEPEHQLIGSLNEDFAIESMAGDVFQLGNASYRILRVEQNSVRVEDAHGEPPSIPFWIGEAPGRTDELSQAVSRLREEVASRLVRNPTGALDTSRAQDWLMQQVGLNEAAARQLVEYLAAAHAALGCLPTQHRIVFERFFDEGGGMQLVIHSPFGSRINRAWGLALRKRFCRTFNFELQAAATEDTIILSLTTAHSFELQEVAKYLHPNTAREILIQAMLDSPMFTTRWRWDASISLALPRFRAGKKIPPQIARMNAEDLLAAVFPDQVACGENIVGDRQVPDHPLVTQTVRDCLEEAMDFEGFKHLLLGLQAGTIEVEARDLTEPSPLALEVLSARPYAFLDDAPLEERRTRAVMGRRFMDPESAADIGRLDAGAIAKVREEAWPDAASEDELHDALLWLTCMSEAEVTRTAPWPGLSQRLIKQHRATWLQAGNVRLLITAERIPWFQALYPHLQLTPSIKPPAAYDQPADRDEALREIIRGRLNGLGPVRADELALTLGLTAVDIDPALLALEAEGSIMRGQFEGDEPQWCDRRLLARIHRYTVKRLRAEIEPVAARDYLRFLFDWQHVTPDTRMQGPDAVPAILAQLEGFDTPAGAWETEVLPARVGGYEPHWLDEQCQAGRIVWTRLSPRSGDAQRGAAPVRATPIALLPRRNVRTWSRFAGGVEQSQLTDKARQVLEVIDIQGASFFDELIDGTRLLAVQVEEALAELVALGLVNSDSFGGLRALLVPADRRRGSTRHGRRRRIALFGMQDAGRWALVRRQPAPPPDDPVRARQQQEAAIEALCHTLLRRWGVVFWKLLEREASWLPPWRELLYCLRRLEARGDIRGGRFVAGFSGEQFALPDAVDKLRQIRRQPTQGQLVSLSAADPLNLVGILTPGARLPSLTGNRVLYRDGVPVAVYAGSEVKLLEPLEPAEEWQVRSALLRRQVPAPLAELA